MAEPSRTFDFFLLISLLMLLIPAKSSSDAHHYNVGDPVPLFVNKVGPFNNPSETYQYYDLPFCRSDVVMIKRKSFAEVMNGDRQISSLYELNFRKNKNSESTCKKKLSKKEVEQFRDAVKRDYYYQMYYDDLPFWGFIGKIDQSEILTKTSPRYFLFKHIQFHVLYNQNRIIEIRSFSDPNYSVDITEAVAKEIEFTHSIHWDETNANFEGRMEKYLRDSLLPQHQKIHWFSIINSILVSALLIGFLAAVLMRTLKNELNKYSCGDEEDDKEVGWKYIHGDVFRYPPFKYLLCAFLGSGTQLLTLVFFLFILAFVGVFYPYNRGLLYISLVTIYALTSFIAGYTATSFHAQWGGKKRVRLLLLTGSLFPGPAFLTFSVLNIIALSYSATAALPVATVVGVLAACIALTVPLLLVGSSLGKISVSQFQPPCTIKRHQTEIPHLSWYRRTVPQMFLAGLLPFSAIFIELHYVVSSLWGHKVYTVYGIWFITFIILILVTTVLAVGLTYLQLAGEDHRWWWRSVMCGGSTSIFMYGYCCYFYSKSEMTGVMQLSFFFGYNACICYAFFLILGTVSFRASLLFVCRIYRATKSE